MAHRPIIARFWIISTTALGLALACAPQGTSTAPAPTAADADTVLAEPDPIRRVERWAGLLQAATPDDHESILEAYHRSGLENGDSEIVMLAIWWAQHDPEGAYRWARRDWGASSWNVLAAIFRVWAIEDPRAAIDQAAAIRFEVQRDAAVGGALSGWEASGKPGLLHYLSTIEDDVKRQQHAALIGQRRVATLGSEAALEWARGIENPVMRNLMSTRVASAVASRHPETAAKWVEDRVTAGSDLPSGHPRRVGTRWVRTDPDAAFSWLQGLPAGKDRDDGVMETFRDWYRNEPADARAWATEVDRERWAEPALSVYAKFLSGEDPEGALAIAMGFSDQPLRDRIVTVIARNWLERDWDAADAWIKQADLSDGVRERSYMVRQERFRPKPAEAPPAPAPADAS